MLDIKKILVEKLKIEQIKKKKSIEEFEKISENKRREMLKDLVDKLRLSEKFVKFQKF